MARQLPLDSPNWKPFKVLHQRLTERTGSPHLAAADLTQVVRGERGKRLRVMVRRAALSPKHPERELPPPEFWEHWKICSWSSGLSIDPRVPSGIVTSLRGFYFYGWEPDFKKNFPEPTAPVAKSNRAAPNSTQPSKPSGKIGRPTEVDWLKIHPQIAKYVIEANPNDTPADVGRKVENWCAKNMKKAPSPSALAAAVSEHWRTLRPRKN
jgi:hypothetical protein